MFLKEDIKNIKVEIFLNDLINLEEIAKLYYVTSDERDNLLKQNKELKNEIENLKILMSKNELDNSFNVERNDCQIEIEAKIK